MSREDFEFKFKIIDLALGTLTDPFERDAYDAKLAEVISPGLGPASRNALVLRPETVARKAEAMAFKADAMALRADAMSIRADVKQFRQAEDAPKSTVARVLAGVKTPLRRIVVALGTVAAVAMIIQVLFVVYAVRKSEQIAKEAVKAEEKLIVQEHYQQYGERPKSAAEAALLEEERRRKENEQRAAEREKERAEEEARRFHQDFKRTAEEVSAELRHAEEVAKREEAYKRAQAEEEKRIAELAERERVEREKEKWQQILTR